MRFHFDERRAFWGDIFDTPHGDFNAVCLKTHIPIAWHRHQHQDDHLFVLAGGLRVRMFKKKSREDMVEHVLLGWAEEPKTVTIPRGWWHGYEAMFDGTVILQFNGPGKWDGSDEERASLTDIPWRIPTP